ncbi:uncharacterized protein LOC110888791 [Helianthus annuus]|uniref:uncharacterized protein LOC110888791 n=1 Tax=Helianthus annuus TaxID=4232 RepID=UPI000B90053C|nr:uncharacterized protein LOC110888791 [Helianthus annuus]
MDRYTSNQGKVVWFWGSENTLSSNDLEIEWGECLAMIEKVNIQLKSDIWLWKTGAEAEEFMVSKLRSELDRIDTMNETRVIKWLHWIPKKVNCFLWRLVLDRLTTREALQLRHIPLTSISCPFCNNAVESVNHLLVSCDLAQQIWTVIFQWTKLSLPRYTLSVVQLLELILSHKCNKIKKRSLYVVVAATCWKIWLTRNDIIFKQKSTSVSKMIADIKAVSFTWINNRAGLSDLGWDNWRSFNF